MVKSPEATVSLTVRITHALHTRLLKEKLARGKDLKDMVREAVERYLAEENR